MIIADNLTFFKVEYGLSQKKISGIGKFDATRLSHLKAGKTVGKSFLVLVARIISDETNIPLELFEDGQALLTKDFEKLLTESEQFLYDKDSPQHPLPKTISDLGGNNLPAGKLFSHEESLPYFLRKINGGLPVPEASIGYLIRIFRLSKGKDTILKNLVGILEDLGDLKNDQGKTNEG